jgi:hypothetical protein
MCRSIVALAGIATTSRKAARSGRLERLRMV